MREEVDQKTGEAETAGMLERRETGGITEEAVRRRALAGIRIGEKRARLRGRQKNCGFSFLQRKRTWKRKRNYCPCFVIPTETTRLLSIFPL